MNRYDASELRREFAAGRNIAEWLREREQAATNSPTAIQYAYDVQAGTYVTALENERYRSHKMAVAAKLASILDAIGPTGLLDAGVGEATTLAPVLKAMKRAPQDVLGFDISLSRLLYARRNLASNRMTSPRLFMAGLEHIPLADASVDVVLTVHALEPNHGHEVPLLRELLRVARRNLVMIEPSYELGSAATKARIERHGYVRGLVAALAQLGVTPNLWEAWELDYNVENQAALIVVEKPSMRSDERPGPAQFVSPISGAPLTRREDCWFCPTDGHAFPIISGISCLALEQAVLASHLQDF